MVELREPTRTTDIGRGVLHAPCLANLLDSSAISPTINGCAGCGLRYSGKAPQNICHDGPKRADRPSGSLGRSRTRRMLCSSQARGLPRAPAHLPDSTIEMRSRDLKTLDSEAPSALHHVDRSSAPLVWAYLCALEPCGFRECTYPMRDIGTQ